MPKIYPFLPVLLMICISAGAQQTTSDNNFSLELPSYWKKEGKVWRMLAEKLPEYCPELSGKQVCADCPQTEYKVVWLMSEPLVMGQDVKEVSNSRNPAASRVNSVNVTVQGTNGRDSIIATRANFNPRMENYSTRWNIRIYYSFQFSFLLLDNKDSILRRIILVDTDEMFVKNNDVVTSSYFETSPVTPANYIVQNQEKLFPRQTDLFVIVGDKLSMLK